MKLATLIDGTADGRVVLLSPDHERCLPAGTIVGSGTVFNADHVQRGSSRIAERRAIEMIANGGARTDYMRFDDRVCMEARAMDDRPLFGTIDQQVVCTSTDPRAR